MKTSELIEYLKVKDVSDDQAYAVVTSDLEAIFPDGLPKEAEGVAEYYIYKIQNVLIPVIHALRSENSGLDKDIDYARNASDVTARYAQTLQSDISLLREVSSIEKGTK